MTENLCQVRTNLLKQRGSVDMSHDVTSGRRRHVTGISDTSRNHVTACGPTADSHQGCKSPGKNFNSKIFDKIFNQFSTIIIFEAAVVASDCSAVSFYICKVTDAEKYKTLKTQMI